MIYFQKQTTDLCTMLPFLVKGVRIDLNCTFHVFQFLNLPKVDILMSFSNFSSNIITSILVFVTRDSFLFNFKNTVTQQTVVIKLWFINYPRFIEYFLQSAKHDKHNQFVQTSRAHAILKSKKNLIWIIFVEHNFPKCFILLIFCGRCKDSSLDSKNKSFLCDTESFYHKPKNPMLQTIINSSFSKQALVDNLIQSIFWTDLVENFIACIIRERNPIPDVEHRRTRLDLNSHRKYTSIRHRLAFLP